MEWLSWITEFTPLSVLVRLLLAGVMGGLIGVERQRQGRAAGMRTHILVCVGAAMTALTGLYVQQALLPDADVLRLAAQVISGIGFLGAGIILVRNRSVITGLTTAAGMWATATIGVAVGFGFYLGALLATGVCIFAVAVLGISDQKKKKIIFYYLELSDPKNTGAVYEKISQLPLVNQVEILPAKSGCVGMVGLRFSTNQELPSETKQELSALEGILFLVQEQGG